MNRPDFSDYLAHFTTDRKPCVTDVTNNIGMKWEGVSAYDRLVSMLQERKINATIMPWTKVPAVCLTECPWSGILAHTKRYSPYGIGFSKSFVYSKHGGPVFYMRPDHFIEQKEDKKFAKHVLPFITPFSPTYRPAWMKRKYDIQDVDYTHEREWRVPHDFTFQYRDIKFVILKDYNDMAKFPQNLKDLIGRDKFILMDNYKKVEELWPVHIM